MTLGRTAAARRALLRRRRLLEDDVVFRCTVGPFAVAAVRATRAVENARGRWAWDASQARFWGAHAAATTLAASFLSGEERVRARLALPPPRLEDGSVDPGAALYVASTEALALGEVRGSIEESVAHNGSFEDVSLTVDRILYGANTPFTSSVSCPGAFESMHSQARINDGDDLPSELLVQKAWTEYLNASDQSRAAHVFLSYDGEAFHSDEAGNADHTSSVSPWFGGLMVQALGRKGEAVAPTDQKARELDITHDDMALQTLAEHWKGIVGEPRAASALMREIADSQGLEACVEAFISTPLDKPVENPRVYACDFYCRCTREQFIGRLAALPRDDLIKLIEDDGGKQMELRCHNCNEQYRVEAADLQALVDMSHQ